MHDTLTYFDVKYLIGAGNVIFVIWATFEIQTIKNIVQLGHTCLTFKNAKNHEHLVQ